MKLKLIISFCLLLVLASCSQQKFTFRQTVRIKNNQKTPNLVMAEKHHVAQVNAPHVALPGLIPSRPEKVEINRVENVTRIAYLSKPTTLLTDTLKKKYNFGVEADRTESKNSSDTTFMEESSKYDKAAVTGLVLGIVGLFFILTSIPGLIFSIKGLKSRKNHGLAVVGLVLSSIFAAILVLYIIIMILFLSAY